MAPTAHSNKRCLATNTPNGNSIAVYGFFCVAHCPRELGFGFFVQTLILTDWHELKAPIVMRTLGASK
jgi:hypothetical protein